MDFENQPLDSTYSSGGDELVVTSEMKNYLLETAKWAKFLAIMGFIFIVLMTVAAFGMGAVFSKAMENLPSDNPAAALFQGGMGIGLTIFYLLIGLLYFFPTLYLYQFATRIKIAIYNNLEIDFAYALSRLKSVFKFMGIFVIVILAFYVLVLAAVLIGVAVGNS